MNFKDYQEEARKTAVYPNQGSNYVYTTLGLMGEAGEVAEKVKKSIRDSVPIDSEFTQEIAKELGDVLWYLSQLCTEFGLSFDAVARMNLDKLSSRKARGVIHGSGDNR